MFVYVPPSLLSAVQLIMYVVRCTGLSDNKTTHNENFDKYNKV